MIIRPGTVADAETIAAVHVAGWHETYRGLMPDAMLDGLSVKNRAAEWRAGLESDPPAVSVFVAADSAGRMVGFAAGGPDRQAGLASNCEIYALYVLRAARSQGAGRALMGALAAHLRDRGFRRTRLWVLRDNASGRGFYERLGGRIGGERICKHPHGTLVDEANW